MWSGRLTGKEFPLRTFVPITTLLIAAVAGAQSAPLAAHAAGSSATHEVHDRASRQIMACACRSSGQGSMTCEQCTAVTQPTIRVTGQGKYVEASDSWSDVSDRLRGDPGIRAVLGDLEIRLDGRQPEFVIACRQTPGDRQYVRPGITMPMQPDILTRVIRGHVEQACTTAPARAELAPETTAWGGCPMQDDYDRRGFQRSANPKIRITAQPDSHGDEWSRLRFDLVMDDLIYHCTREFIIDPVSASGAGAKATFRANVTLVCANDPTRRAEFDTVVPEMNRGDFRRFIGTMLKRTCGLPATTASRGAR